MLLAWAHFSDNKCDYTWSRFLEFVKKVLPEFDADNVVVYRDGRNSITKGLNRYLTLPRRMACVRHAAEAAAHSVRGAGIAAQYTKLACAQSVQRLTYLQQQAPAALLTYVNNSAIPENQRFLATFGAAYGKTQATLSDTADTHQLATAGPRSTSQFVEVNMASANADGSRGMAPTEMVIQTVNTWERRLMERKLAADSCTAAVTPQVGKMARQSPHEGECSRCEPCRHTARWQYSEGVAQPAAWQHELRLQPDKSDMRMWDDRAHGFHLRLHGVLCKGARGGAGNPKPSCNLLTRLHSGRPSLLSILRLVYSRRRACS